MHMQKSISDQISTLKHLPILPHILLQLIKICNKENGNLKEISSIIEKDPALASKILKLVNSAYFAPNRKIAKLDDAVGIIGTNAVKNIAICSSVHEVFHKASMSAALNIKSFWWHSIRCAILARLIAKYTKFKSPDEAFLSGILHDIGKLVLWVNFPKQYSELLTAYPDRPDLVRAGESQMGAGHAEIGAWLLERWGFESFVSDSVLYHHYPMHRLLDALPLVRLVYVSNALNRGATQEIEEGFTAAEKLLGLSRSVMEDLLVQTDSELMDVAESMGIEVEQAETKAVAFSEKDREKQKELAQEIRDWSLLLGTIQNLLGAADEAAILKEAYHGLQTLFDVTSILFFAYDAESNCLHGSEHPTDKKSSGIRDLIVPLHMEKSLLIACLGTRTFTDSFSRPADSTPAILDEQIIRFLGKEGMVCLPLLAYGEQVGVIVLGMNQVDFFHLVTQIKLLKMFADQVAVALRVYQLRHSQLRTIQLERAGASSALARKVVHEVNNPLSIIKNYLKILGMKLAAENVAQDEIRIINEEINRVALILRELTGFSKERVRQVEPVDVNVLLSDLLKITTESLLDQFNVRVHLDLQAGLPPVMADRNSLKQVFLNLVKNGVEAMTEGGDLRIVTRQISSQLVEGPADDAAESVGYAEIVISDTGPGIANEVKTRLFEPLVSTKSGNHAGLGLSIVHSVIQSLDGTIQCESAPSKGTSFRIRLPIHGGDRA